MSQNKKKYFSKQHYPVDGLRQTDGVFSVR